MMMAGPCAVESEKQLMETALFLKNREFNFYAVVPTSPNFTYSFQGLGEEGLKR